MVARALAEDLGESGDLTSRACVPAGLEGTARVVVREAGVVYGLGAARAAFAAVDRRLAVEEHVEDGERMASGAAVLTVGGPLRPILTAERTVLNLLGHLSGVATLTRRYVDAVAGTGCRVRDTRKTTPGLRLLEKAAVRAGGGTNHRWGLADALLIKDSHVAAAGGVAAAIRAALEAAGGLPVQVEVEDLTQLARALEAGATDVLLDNMGPEQVRQAVHRVGERARLEASGRIDLDNVRSYAETGVHRVAVGALTHSARWLDLALEVDTGDGADSPEAPGAAPAEEPSRPGHLPREDALFADPPPPAESPGGQP